MLDDAGLTPRVGEIVRLRDDRARVRLSDGGRLVSVPVARLQALRSVAESFVEGTWQNPMDALLRWQATWLRTLGDAGPAACPAIAWLPHQVLGARAFLASPRQRLLVADDTGTGKTVVAGLVIWLLRRQHLLQRALIVCHASSTEQWRHELRQRFRLSLPIWLLKTRREAKSWEEDGVYITSGHGLAKRLREHPAFARATWDLVVVDEAHTTAAGATGEALRQLLWRGVDRPRTNTRLPGALFLSATPFRGRLREYFDLLDLLDPRFFTATERQEATSGRAGAVRGVLASRREDLATIVRRVRKFAVIDGNGARLFQPPLHLPDIIARPEPKPRRALQAYLLLASAHPDAVPGEGLETAFASSYAALHQALDACERKLSESLAQTPPQRTQTRRLLIFANVTKDPREQGLDALHTLRALLPSSAELAADPNRDPKLRQFLAELPKLYFQAHRHNAEDMIDGLSAMFSRIAGDPSVSRARDIVVFVSRLSTCRLVAAGLRRTPASPTVLELNCDQSAAERQRLLQQTAGNLRVLVCVKVGEESLNLEQAHILVHYDPPANPFQEVQRLGRVSRLTQDRRIVVATVRGPSLDPNRHRELAIADETTVRHIAERLRPLLPPDLPEPECLEQARIELATQVPGLALDFEKAPADALRQACATWTDLQAAVPELPDLATDFERLFDGLHARDFETLAQTFTARWAAVRSASLDETGDGDWQLTLPEDRLPRAERRTHRVHFHRSQFAITDDACLAPGHPLLEAMLDDTLADPEFGRTALLAAPAGFLHRLWGRHFDYLFLFTWHDPGSGAPRLRPIVLGPDLCPSPRTHELLTRLRSPAPWTAVDDATRSWLASRWQPTAALAAARQLLSAQRTDTVFDLALAAIVVA